MDTGIAQTSIVLCLENALQYEYVFSQQNWG